MAFKKEIKKNEARILIFIQNADISKCYLSNISQKLGIDYAYIIKLVNGMHNKYWIKKIKRDTGKTFIQPAYKCPEMDKLTKALD